MRNTQKPWLDDGMQRPFKRVSRRKDAPAACLFTTSEALATAAFLIILACLVGMMAGYTHKNDSRATCAYMGGNWSESAGECIGGAK